MTGPFSIDLGGISRTNLPGVVSQFSSRSAGTLGLDWYALGALRAAAGLRSQQVRRPVEQRTIKKERPMAGKKKGDKKKKDKKDKKDKKGKKDKK